MKSWFPWLTFLFFDPDTFENSDGKVLPRKLFLWALLMEIN